jgi:hypothetical protein
LEGLLLLNPTLELPLSWGSAGPSAAGVVCAAFVPAAAVVPFAAVMSSLPLPFENILKSLLTEPLPLMLADTAVCLRTDCLSNAQTRLISC